MWKRLNICIIIVAITYLVFHSLISLLQSRSIPGHCFQFPLVAWSMKIKKSTTTHYRTELFCALLMILCQSTRRYSMHCWITVYVNSEHGTVHIASLFHLYHKSNKFVFCILTNFVCLLQLIRLNSVLLSFVWNPASFLWNI